MKEGRKVCDGVGVGAFNGEGKPWTPWERERERERERESLSSVSENWVWFALGETQRGNEKRDKSNVNTK